MVSVEEFEKAVEETAEAKSHRTTKYGAGMEFPEMLQNLPGVIQTSLGAVTIVEDFGGEGMGDELRIVAQLTPTSGAEPEFFMYKGRWISWDGAYWDGTEGHKVRPKEVTTIRYDYI